MEILSQRLDETAAAAKDILRLLSRDHRRQATVLALSGDLGSGKTTFTQFLARELGVEDYVTSPTFVIEKIYEVKNFGYENLIHIDCYRLNSEKELEILGWKDIVSQPKNLIVLEWPERVAGILPIDTFRIKFESVSEKERRIVY